MVRWSGGRSSSTRGRHSYRLLLTTTTTTTGDPAHGPLCEEAAAVDGRHALRLGALLRDPWRAALLLARQRVQKQSHPQPTSRSAAAAASGLARGSFPTARGAPPPHKAAQPRLPGSPRGCHQVRLSAPSARAPRRVALRTPDHAHGRALCPHAVLAMYSQAHDRPLGRADGGEHRHLRRLPDADDQDGCAPHSHLILPPRT